jgi:hypothetical protein
VQIIWRGTAEISNKHVQKKKNRNDCREKLQGRFAETRNL